jgi:hypothetical protein
VAAFAAEQILDFVDDLIAVCHGVLLLLALLPADLGRPLVV